MCNGVRLCSVFCVSLDSLIMDGVGVPKDEHSLINWTLVFFFFFLKKDTNEKSSCYSLRIYNSVLTHGLISVIDK